MLTKRGNACGYRALLTIAAALAPAAIAAAQFNFDPAITIAPGDRPDGIAGADFDGDGFGDFAVTTDNLDKVSVYFSNGDGTFSPPTVILTGAGTGAGYVAIADLDGDGDDDMAVALHNVSAVLPIMNTGARTFALGASTSVGNDPRHIATGDFTGDGLADLATVNRSANSVTILINMGGATFSTATVGVGLDPRADSAADFDGDGDIDLVVTNHDDRTISILSNDGAGNFAVSATLSVGANVRPSGVTTADFNGDGASDIAVATSGGGGNFATLLYNNGAGGFSAPVNFPTGGQNPDTIIASDLNCDGAMDIAVTNQDSNTLAVLGNDGLGNFGAPVLLSTGLRPGNVAAADFDGDGADDLATANRDSNDVSIFFNNTCPAIIMPTGFEVTRGTLLSGVLEDLFESDDSRVMIQQRPPLFPTDPNAQIVVDGLAGESAASALSFTLEASTSALPASGVRQRIELFNFNTNSYEIVDERSATSADSVVTVNINVDASRFIDPGTTGVRARIGWFQQAPLLAPNWLVRIDQTVWTLTP